MPGKPFHAEVSPRPDENSLQVQFSGVMDENSRFPDVELGSVGVVQIETGDLSYVNSIGIQHLIQWVWNLEKARPDIMILFKNTPPILAKQFAVLVEHFPKKTVFGSIYAPYYCDDCEFESDHLIVLERDCEKNAGGEVIVRDPPICASCKVEMKPDPLFQSQVLGGFFKFRQNGG